LGLNRAAKLAHMMEDLLQNLADTGRPLSPEVTDALLKCTDALRHYVEGLKHGAPEVVQFNQVAHELLSAELTGQPAAETPPKTATGSEQPPTSSAGEQEAGCHVSDELREKVGAVASDPDATLVGAVAFEADLPLVGLKAQLLYEKLSNLGEICSFSPPVETLDDVEKLDGISFGVTTEKPLQAVQRALRVAGVQEIHMEPLVSPKPSAPAKTPKDGPEESAAGPAAQQAAAKTRKSRTADGGARPTETLRVDIERLDQLMNLAGQLVINKARFAQIGNSLKAALTGKQSSQVLKNALVVLGRMADGEDGPGEEAALQAELKNLRSQAQRIQHDLESVRRDFEMLTGMRTSVNDLLETIHQLDRVSDGIQQSVMDTRMLPIGPLFARFKRVIRDITRSNGKDIKLVINGEKTELDKRMIDEPKLGRPRNRIAGGPRGSRQTQAGHRDAGRLPSRQQHHHPGQRRRQRIGPPADPAQGPRTGTLHRGRTGEDDPPPDLPTDLGARAEHRRKGDPGLRARHGNGYRQVQNRRTQRNGRPGERAGSRNHADHQAPLDPGDSSQPDGGDRWSRSRRSSR